MQIKLKQKSENIRKMKQLQMMRKIIYNKLANRQDPEHRMQPAHPASSEAAKMTARWLSFHGAQLPLRHGDSKLVLKNVEKLI